MTNASLQDVLGTILCVGVYVAIVSYMLIWPGIQVVRKYINNDMLIAWYKKQTKDRAKERADVHSGYNSRLELLEEQNAILTRRLNLLNTDKNTRLLLFALDRLSLVEQGNQFQPVRDVAWEVLVNIPETGRRGCNHTPSCYVSLRNEHEVTIQSWLLPRAIQPFELAQLYLAIFDGFVTTGQGPELRLHLRVRCTSPHCDVKNTYSLTARALTPDGFNEGSKKHFRLRRCILNISGNTPSGWFNGQYLFSKNGVLKYYADFSQTHLRSVA